jgi:1-acyl-sn-glycerol-3-phosphate acyltransferase
LNQNLNRFGEGMDWEKDPENFPVTKGYKRIRAINRALMETWFREISLVDIDTLPDEGGILFTTWHPGGMIDPMLMMTALPGSLTFAAKHTLFKVPILGRIIRTAGAMPVHRAQDTTSSDSTEGNRSAKNSNLIESLGDAVASGGRVAIFPEGVTHLESHPVRLRTGAARILLHAIKKAREDGQPTPHVVPLGLHYSDQHRFRERVSLQVNQPLPIPPLPGEEGAPQPSAEEVEEYEDQAHDRVWCATITELLKMEMNRCNQAQETWEDRELVWRARRMIHVLRASENKAPKGPLPYGQALLGSRRVRAAWQYQSVNDAKRTQQIESEFRIHHEDMNKLGFRSWEITNREERISKRSLFKNFVYWIWSISWMLGIVSWGAVIGSIPPYMFTRLITNKLGKSDSNKSIMGTMKLFLSVLIYPIWWILISLPIGWFISSSSSPLQDVNIPSIIIPLLAEIPWLLTTIIVLFWWPLSARIHLKLYARASRSWRALRLGFKLRSGDVKWDALLKTHATLAQELATIGAGLVLPGDPDWVDPEPGVDDWQVVQTRP